MKIAEIHALSKRGTVLFSRTFSRTQDDVLDAILRMLVKDPSCIEPAMVVANTNIYTVQQNDVIVLAISHQDLNALLVCETLSRFLKLCKDFCGVVSSNCFHSNFVLIQELLEEMFNGGYLVLGSYEKIKPFVHSEPVARKASGPLSTGLFGQEQLPLSGQSWAKQTGSAPPTQGEKKNDLYVDVIERVTAVFDQTCTLTRSDVIGEIHLTSYVENNPALRVVFNDVKMDPGEEQFKGYGKQVYLSGCKFHQNVKENKLVEDHSLVLMPAQGEMIVMSYMLQGELAHGVPLRLYSSVRTTPEGHDLLLDLQLRCEVNSSTTQATDLAVNFKVPTTTRNVSQQFDPHNQKAEFSSSSHSVKWRIESVSARTPVSALFRLIDANLMPEQAKLELGPAQVDFEMADYLCSNLQLKSVKCLRQSNTQLKHVGKWIRYITKPDLYSFQLS